MKKLLQTIIALLCLLIGNRFMPVMAETEILDYIVAVVNDDVIVNTVLQEELNLALKEWRQKTRESPPYEALKKRVLERLIMEKLQLQQAQRTGIKIDDSRLNERIRKIAAQQQMDLAGFRERLLQEGHSYEKVRETVRNQMIMKRLQRQQIVNRITITEREIENFLANQAQQGTENNEYHIWHILIATPLAPSPEDIESKQQQAQEVLAKLKEGTNFGTMALKVSEGSNAIRGGDLGWLKAGEMPTLFNGVVNNMIVGDIRGPLRNASGFHIIKLVEKRGNEQTIVMQSKVRHILMKTSEIMSKVEVQKHLEELKYRIEQGDDFATLAAANSQDVKTAANGGLIGWVNPGESTWGPVFEEIMSSLPENQVSTPFQSPHGWHILQVLERREYDNTEQALRTQATYQIHQRKIEEEFQSWARQLRDQSYVEYRLEDISADDF